MIEFYSIQENTSLTLYSDESNSRGRRTARKSLCENYKYFSISTPSKPQLSTMLKLDSHFHQWFVAPTWVSHVKAQLFNMLAVPASPCFTENSQCLAMANVHQRKSKQKEGKLSFLTDSLQIFLHEGISLSHVVRYVLGLCLWGTYGLNS